ncbi:DgyrCDS14150 [Dimorphilus gyrociliatus]|uniref:DgyrCDS14150 n=1 Tax=Dimorphilus gyrociliatus TaxID=2664684 RepID=A0A7I8WCQ5_9ANNE|nr:DgyrCDS14150 [Dimorphilus gyrociliatus]
MERWMGRVAIITGASSGIGQAIAKKLTIEGMVVFGVARSFNKLNEFADKLGQVKGTFIPMQCDVRKEDDILKVFAEINDKYGGVDILINNAGIAKQGSILEGKRENWMDMIEVNVVAYADFCREAYKSMKKKGIDDGHLINISSLIGHIVFNLPSYHFYAATKHSVKALTEAIRQELRNANSHIRASAVSSGMVETDFFNLIHGKEESKQICSYFKCLQPEDIANTVVHIIQAPPHVEVSNLYREIIMKIKGVCQHESCKQSLQCQLDFLDSRSNSLDEKVGETLNWILKWKCRKTISNLVDFLIDMFTYSEIDCIKVNGYVKTYGTDVGIRNHEWLMINDNEDEIIDIIQFVHYGETSSPFAKRRVDESYLFYFWDESANIPKHIFSNLEEFKSSLYINPLAYSICGLYSSTAEFKDIKSEYGVTEIIFNRKNQLNSRPVRFSGSLGNNEEVLENGDRFIFIEQISGCIRIRINLPKNGYYSFKLNFQIVDGYGRLGDSIFVCSYEIFCENVRYQPQPYPFNENFEWGLISVNHVWNLGLKGVLGGRVISRYGVLRLEFQADNLEKEDVNFELRSNFADINHLRHSYVCWIHENSIIVIHIRFPLGGYYALDVLVRKRNSDEERKLIGSYLLCAEQACLDRRLFPVLPSNSIGIKFSDRKYIRLTNTEPLIHLKESVDDMELLIEKEKTTEEGNVRVKWTLYHDDDAVIDYEKPHFAFWEKRSEHEYVVKTKPAVVGIYLLSIDIGNFAIYVIVICDYPAKNLYPFPSILNQTEWQRSSVRLVEPLRGLICKNSISKFSIKLQENCQHRANVAMYDNGIKKYSYGMKRRGDINSSEPFIFSHFSSAVISLNNIALLEFEIVDEDFYESINDWLSLEYDRAEKFQSDLKYHAYVSLMAENSPTPDTLKKTSSASVRKSLSPLVETPFSESSTPDRFESPKAVSRKNSNSSVSSSGDERLRKSSPQPIYRSFSIQTYHSLQTELKSLVTEFSERSPTLKNEDDTSTLVGSENEDETTEVIDIGERIDSKERERTDIKDNVEYDKVSNAGRERVDKMNEVITTKEGEEELKAKSELEDENKENEEEETKEIDDEEKSNEGKDDEELEDEEGSILETRSIHTNSRIYPTSDSHYYATSRSNSRTTELIDMVTKENTHKFEADVGGKQKEQLNAVDSRGDEDEEEEEFEESWEEEGEEEENDEEEENWPGSSPSNYVTDDSLSSSCQLMLDSLSNHSATEDSKVTTSDVSLAVCQNRSSVSSNESSNYSKNGENCVPREDIIEARADLEYFTSILNAKGLKQVLKVLDLRPKLKYHLRKDYKKAEELIKDLDEYEITVHRVLKLNNNSVAELISYRKPSPIIHRILQAVLLVFGFPERKTRDFVKVKKLLKQQNLLKRIHDTKPEMIETSLAQEAHQLITDIDMDEVKDKSAAAAAIFKWVSYNLFIEFA